MFIHLAGSYLQKQVSILNFVINQVSSDQTSSESSYNNAATVNTEGHLQQESHINI